MSKKKMTDEVFESICSELEETHHGLVKLCGNHNTTKSAFFNYKDGLNEEQRQKNIDVYEARHDRYARAREKQLDYLEELLREEAFNDSDDEKPFVGVNHIQRDKLKVDTLKFILGKLRARKWGDKIDVTSDGKKIDAVNVTIVKPDQE